MEDRETRLKRLKMRSWRRGTKEMDLVLGPYADTQMSKLNDIQLDAYEDLIGQEDQVLYDWVIDKTPTPEQFQAAMDRIKRHLHTML